MVVILIKFYAVLKEITWGTIISWISINKDQLDQYNAQNRKQAFCIILM
jgi:hypothetical protein